MVDRLAPRAEDIHERTGLFLTAYYGASKLRWCLDHFDTVAAAQRDGRLACGPLASYLLHRLLDESPLLTDPANAARTLLWNPAQRDWDPWLLELFGIPVQLLPRCVDSRHEYGHLRIDDRSIPFRICMGDQPAALFAYGEPGTRQAYVNVGTGAFVQRILTQDPGRPQNLLSGIAARDGDRTTWVIEGTVNGAGSALSAVEAELGLEEEDVKRILPQWLSRRCSPPLFLNGVSGLGSPFWVPDFASRFVGDGDEAEKMVAVVESIVFLIQVNLESMTRLAGAPQRIVVTGGLAALDGLCQRLVDSSGIAIYRPREREATARGTAFLLAGRPALWPETEPGEHFAPCENPALQQRYRAWSRAMQEGLAT
jgi:glycerol kinase